MWCGGRAATPPSWSGMALPPPVGPQPPQAGNEKRQASQRSILLDADSDLISPAHVADRPQER